MIIIIGLGNPGLKYKKTRHNAGFMVIDFLQKEYGFSKFKFEKKFKADVAKGLIGEEEILLVKPQTFMNNSGLAVKMLIGNWKLEIGNCLVIHDDFDLPLGEIKLSENSGSAGHHGIESIIKAIGSNNFKRIRIGIRPLQKNDNFSLKAEDFVLKKFSKQEQQIMQEVIKKAGQLIVETIAQQ